ncbi:putative GTPase activating protein for Arf-domain-containing protein [Amylocystis lapponica]|nr:putative GTPase activating protein for Arf-domain-containing protein [Amylocystis lapponica]
MSHTMNKMTVERNQRALLDLANLPGKASAADVCADCKARTPRWASHNLGSSSGVVNCASVHRKMGTHISKVKSVTLDSWTKEQLDVMRQMGNVKSNAFYNPNETRHPPPTNMVDSERDSDLEKFIRSKYEFKSFIDKSAKVAAVLGPSRSASSRLSPAPASRPQTAPALRASSPSSKPPMPPPKQPSPPGSLLSSGSASALPSSISQSQFRSASQPISSAPSQYNQVQPQLSTQSQPPSSTSSNWNDLVSLQSSTNSSFPLQYAAAPPTSASQPISISTQAPTSHLSVAANPYSGLSVSPASSFPSSMNQMTGVSPGGAGRSMSLNSGMTLNTGLGYGASINPGGPSPFQPSQPSFGTPSPIPHPFAPQSLPSGPGMAFGQQQQPVTPFSASPFQPQGAGSPYPQAQAPPMFQQSMSHPQMQLQMPPQGNPFQMGMQQSVHTPFSAQPQFGMGSPSPFGQLQQQQQQLQQQQQQQQQQFTPTPGSVFSGWQNGQQPGFPGQQWS